MRNAMTMMMNEYDIGINQCLCMPKSELDGSSAVTWLRFWCSTRLLMLVKKCISYRRKTCNHRWLKSRFVFLRLYLYYHHSYSFFNCISQRPSWTLETQPNSAVHGFPRKPEHFFSSKSSWTPETQPNDALRRRLVEFLVFNSAFGRWP